MNIIDLGLSFISSRLTMRNVNLITRLYVHHRDGYGDVQSIHEDHKNNKGWAGIGYNFYIRKDGNIYKGRPLMFVPAGVLGDNEHSVHVCFEGMLNSEFLTPSQMESGRAIVDYLKVTIPSLVELKGHREFISTDCPGYNFPLQVFKDYFNRRGDTHSINNNLGVDTMGVIRIGENSNRVIVLQKMLNIFGYNLIIDGDFGNNTYNAVKDFQARNALASDGIVGNMTASKLCEMLKQNLGF